VRLLLATHALVWFLLGDSQLSSRSHIAIEAPPTHVFVSVATVWEIAIKVGLGKWPDAESLLADIETRLAAVNFAVLPISIAHVRHAGMMVAAHRDPFDRLLAAQAAIEGLIVVTTDQKLVGLGVPVLW
jgi:PIN domain nuclease of toxin-antitoxin system